jgi:hypothetical protein
MRIDEPDRPVLLFGAVTLLVVGSVLIQAPGPQLSEWAGGSAAVAGGYFLAAWYEGRRGHGE